MKNKEVAKEMHSLLKSYLWWCDQMVDANFEPARIINVDKYYLTEGDIRKIRRMEEPSLEGFMSWLYLKSF